MDNRVWYSNLVRMINNCRQCKGGLYVHNSLFNNSNIAQLFPERLYQKIQH